MIPETHDLERAPQLAALGILETALPVVISAMVSRHPEFEDPAERDCVMPPPASKALAAVLVGLADTLHCVVLRYIAIIESEHDRPPLGGH